MMTATQRQAAAKVLRALAHPTRLAILELLHTHNQMTCKELLTELNISQPLLSQQLAILERQGLIAAQMDGTSKQCTIRNPDFLKLFDCLGKHLQTVLKI